MTMYDVYQRVCAWNKARYDQEYDHGLACDLLGEELEEYLDADTQVEQVDAMCDVVYVALGIMWKMDTQSEVLEHNTKLAHSQIVELLEVNVVEPVYLAIGIMSKLAHVDEPNGYLVQLVMSLCLTQLSYMGFDHDEQISLLLAVCASNDTKLVKKTESHIKANVNDKGITYQPPSLQPIINRMEARHANK